MFSENVTNNYYFIVTARPCLDLTRYSENAKFTGLSLDLNVSYTVSVNFTNFAFGYTIGIRVRNDTAQLLYGSYTAMGE